MASREQPGFPSHEEIDQMHAHTISLLLAEPCPEAMQVYYSSLTELHNNLGLEVKYIGSEMGKGMFASRSFEMDELVLKEHMLVGSQHTQNKADALVCSFCFYFIGSIELQIARRLLLHKEKGLDERQDNCADVHEVGSQPLQTCAAREDNDSAVITEMGFESAECDGSDHIDCEKENMTTNNHLSGLIELISSDNFQLPYSDHFPLPPVVKCFGGCSDELFCSDSCAKAAWESYHSLLCTGPKSHCNKKDQLCKFKNHADETNDIFHVAAKVISSTILKASKFKSEAQITRTESRLCHSDENGAMPLLKAWEPFSMGYKRLWWESLALPADLGIDDEPEFRTQIKEISANSLDLLKGAIFQEDYAPLFSLQVYGHIIGMFELNNLDLVVASPVEDYFIFIDELPLSEKMEAYKVTRPFLDALGNEYDVPCQGTAFFPLQSCINHSCCPNVKAFKRDEDKDGQAVLLATRPIKNGEQITISYIDESSPVEERQAMLEDYGFNCQCWKCEEERV